jgi:dTDP-4-amino-4,6-dideoxygalactose transaminase
VTAAGFKFNMMDIQAALALHQLPKIDIYAERRRRIWEEYQAAFADLGLIRPAPPEPDTRHARHLYTILADVDRLRVDRDHLLNALQAEGIGTGVHYLALHLYPFYQDQLGCRAGDYPNAEFISERTISLPLSAKLSDADVEDVIEAVRKVFRYYEK